MVQTTWSLAAKANFRNSKLTLEHFLLRPKALSLYRNYVRATRDIPNPQARWETIQWFRDDFEKHKAVTDIEHLKDLLIQGNRFLKQMQGQMSLAGAFVSNTNKLRGSRTEP